MIGRCQRTQAPFFMIEAWRRGPRGAALRPNIVPGPALVVALNAHFLLPNDCIRRPPSPHHNRYRDPSKHRPRSDDSTGRLYFATQPIPIMEDPKFDRSHSHSPLPEAGNDPEDPLRPDIDEENSTPNPPIGDPDQDMEVTEKQGGMPDPDDVQEAGLSDNESELSELEDQQFDDDFDASNIAIQERPAQIIDESNVGMISVHKRKRNEGDTERPKTKKKKADRPRRKKGKDDEAEGGEIAVAGSRKSKRSRKEGRTRAASPGEPDENLTPEERT